MSQTTQSPPPTSRPGWNTRLVGAAACTAAVVLVATGVIGGPDALAGAAVGLGLVTIFLLSGRLPVLAAQQFGAGFAFMLLGINYLFRVVLLLVALIALHDATWLDPRVLGVVVIGGALVWNAISLRQHLRPAPAAAVPVSGR